MRHNDWRPYHDGQTLGGTGTENGIILRDEEHPEGARITLEQGGFTPFAITCGVYGWLVHTRFFGTQVEATQAFEAMKRELARLAASVPLERDPEIDDKVAAFSEELHEFVEAFP